MYVRRRDGTFPELSDLAVDQYRLCSARSTTRPTYHRVWDGSPHRFVRGRRVKLHQRSLRPPVDGHTRGKSTPAKRLIRGAGLFWQVGPGCLPPGLLRLRCLLTAAQGIDVGVVGDADAIPIFRALSVGAVPPGSAVSRVPASAVAAGCGRARAPQECDRQPVLAGVTSRPWASSTWAAAWRLG
jgi:hypothetical protein